MQNVVGRREITWGGAWPLIATGAAAQGNTGRSGGGACVGMRRNGLGEAAQIHRAVGTFHEQPQCAAGRLADPAWFPHQPGLPSSRTP